MGAFPTVKVPEWIAEKIKLSIDDLIIILDDDNSIHAAWDQKFKLFLNDFPEMKIVHFTLGTDTMNYIHGLNEEDKQKILLLTDYELLNEDLNGLNVIERTKISRSILVTSHYANKDVLHKAISLQTKVLPKLLASEVPVFLN